MGAEEVDGVLADYFVAVFEGVFNYFRIGVDADGFDIIFFENFEESTVSAAEIEGFLAAFNIRDVLRMFILETLVIAVEFFFKANVIKFEARVFEAVEAFVESGMELIDGFIDVMNRVGKIGKVGIGLLKVRLVVLDFGFGGVDFLADGRDVVDE